MRLRLCNIAIAFTVHNELHVRKWLSSTLQWIKTHTGVKAQTVTAFGPEDFYITN